MRIAVVSLLTIAACTNVNNSGDGGTEGGPDVAPDVIIDPQNCVAPGTANDDEGVGGYCSPGGGQCSASGPGGSPRICTADLAGTAAHTWYCTYPCMGPNDCGTGAQCANTSEGMMCVPPACAASTDGGPEEDGATDADVADVVDAATD